MKLITPIKLKLALAAVLSTGLVAAAPAGAIVDPVQCGKIHVKGKTWKITADQVRCSTAKKWAATYIRSFKAPRYYTCRRAASPSIYRTCSATRYNPDRLFWIRTR